MSRTTRTPPKPDSMRRRAVPGQCRWCDLPIIKPDGSAWTRRTWHPECVQVYKLAFSSDTQRAAVWDRGTVCACCGVDVKRVYKRANVYLQHWDNRAVRLMRKLGPDWRKRRDARILRARVLLEQRRDSLAQQGWPSRTVNDGAWWQADHIQPLYKAQGRLEFWAESNLQLLCCRCHRAKSAQEANERADMRRQSKLALMAAAP